MSNRKPKLLLEDILDSAEKIARYTEGLNFDDFVADSKTADAVIRNFEIIGEASARLPQEFKDLHVDVPWNKIRGLRNRVIHDYFGINYAIIWAIITDFLPDLIKQIDNCYKNI